MSERLLQRRETTIDPQAAGASGRATLPGLALALVENGELAAERAFGFARFPSEAPLGPSHLFQAASIAKCVTAWAVLALVKAGRLSLDTPIGEVITRWSLPTGSFDPLAVTIRRLLGHTAGLSLPDYPGFEPGLPLPPPEASLSGETNGAGALYAIEPAGKRFRYSGGGFALLALAIEELTGARFADHVERTVFRPLGMTRSTFDPYARLLDEAVTGHDADGRPLPFYRFDGAAAAGLCTTAGDLARFALAHLPAPGGALPGRGIVSPAMLAAMVSPAAETRCEDGLWPHYGLGFEIDRRIDGSVAFGHHGMNRGWRALLAIEPARFRAMVLLANSDAAMPTLDALYSRWRTLA